MNSPLGKYANIGALVASLVIIGVWAAQHLLAVSDEGVNQLVLLALGILFGQVGAHSEAVQVAASSLNGTKAELDALHQRLDQLQVPAANATPTP